LIVALHARRSFGSIQAFRKRHPDRAIVVALTGTDLYRDLTRNKSSQLSLDVATRIVVLQQQALAELSPRWREKTRVIYQSVSPSPPKRPQTPATTFDVCVVGHLRSVKDPFRAAMAARLLPRSSRIRVIQLGAAMNAREEERARSEMRSNPRYQWLGEVPRTRVRRVLMASRLFVISSRMEGGANALGEAIVHGLPVVASRIPGSIGILGDHYPGFFGIGDTAGLADLMNRCETDSEFLEELVNECHQLKPLFAPARERSAWRTLLDELVPFQIRSSRSKKHNPRSPK
jgi:putative glycosyltransferase (TIGR04348 family)